MHQWKRIFVYCFSVSSCFLSFSLHAQGKLGFESAEHMLLAENVNLQFSQDELPQTNPILHLKNGLQFTFAQLVALSADFYGIPGKTIGTSENTQQREDCILAQYQSLAEATQAVTEAPKIYAVMQQEYIDLLRGIQKGESSENVYARISENNDRQWNCITGGSCAEKMWWLIPGRYITLAKQDHDHFGEIAVTAYQTAHALAIQTAAIAGKSHDRTQLEKAYVLEAFACHFLSDRFASGHIRTPRYELAAVVTPAVVGSVLASYMHGEDNKNGLHVHNAQGDRWIAFGDKEYLNPRNIQNRAILQKTMQISVNEVFDAYQGKMVQQDNVLSFLPYPDALPGQSSQDTAALFYWDDATHTMYRRSDLEKIKKYEWTSDWWGWTTMLTLSRQRGLPLEAQRTLIVEGYGEKAVKEGLISDKELLHFAMSKNKIL